MTFLLQAFNELSTDRPRQLSQAGQLVGPIPWSSIADYVDRIGLNEQNANWFEAVIRALDSEYLGMEKERLESEASAARLASTMAARRGGG